jgi:hypothetical protein
MTSYYLDYMTPLWKRILYRLFRGFFAGFFGTTATMLIFAGSSIDDLAEWLFTLSVAGVAGGIGGLLLAGDKLLRSEPEDIPQF